MATIEQVPPGTGSVTPAEPNILNSVLARAYTLNWELIFYIAIFFIAIATRLIGLGDRVMSHDESLHVKYSFDLYQSGNFQHTPLMHGPVLFHMTALSYFLFGVNDFTARLYPAVLGIIMVLMPKLMFERWLGKLGAMVGSVLILISPMLLFHHRYIREDTPSIFFTLLMIYAIFAYTDGVNPRRLRYLILFSGAMLLSLGSKEVAFMYIAIFGAILTFIWVMQVFQGLRTGETVIFGLGKRSGNGLVSLLGENTNSLVKLILTGAIVGIVASLGMTIVFSIIPPDSVAGDANLQYGQFSWSMLVFIPLILAVISTAMVRFTKSPLLGFITFAVFGVLTLLFLLDLPIITRVLLGLASLGTLWLVSGMARPGDDVGIPWGDFIITGVIVAATLGIGLLAFVVPLDAPIKLAGIAIILAIIGVVISVVRAGKGMRLPWGSIAFVLAVSAIMAIILITLEERSRAITNPADKGSEIHNSWIFGSWIAAAVIVAFVAWLRLGTRFFQEMKRYPVFDILIVMGSLILPWLAAFPIFFAGYDLSGSMTDANVIGGSILGVLPFLIVSAATGIAWNPGWWIACAATFYSLFVFFYTTVFTNMYGLGTGMVGSLGYWLVQQGERRGSQPQYYYFLELGIYEYLPVIGAAFAGFVGLLGMWRFRRERLDEAAETERLRAEAAMAAESVAAAETVDMTTGEALPSEPITTYEVADQPVVETLPAMEGGLATASSVDMPDAPEEAATAILTEEPPKREIRPVNPAERLDRIPFLPFVGWWALLILMGYTMAGEKMPWLTTHLTIPLGFLTAWYLGTQLERIDWSDFWKRGWGVILLTPVLLVALANVVGIRPFASLEREDLLRTTMWMGAVLIVGLLGYGIAQIWRRIGTHQTMRIVVLGIFVLLGIITARHAWMAAYIYYDSAREFLVYAHGGPAHKAIIAQIDDISKRTTDGNAIKIAYDNHMSWPGSWYFQKYPNARYLGDDPHTATDLDSYVAIAVGDANNPKIEPLLVDKFYKQKLIRMWWPMQDYFDLRKPRIDNVFAGDTNLPEGWISGSKLRQGLWDIWWNHDYKAYGDATGKNFDESNWPVADWMYFYVRKDVAAQVWDFGTGAVKVSGLPEDPFNKLRCDTCQPETVFGAQGSDVAQLNFPRDIAIGTDGNLYVADSQNNRISVFSPDGQALRQFGTAGSVDQNNVDNVGTGGQFREPWGVAVGQDGKIYVADTWNHRVQVFNNDGTFIRAWGSFEQVPSGSSGTKPDGFWGPRDIAVDAENNVYVADTGNKRIRVYDVNGTLKFDIGADSLNEPVGLVINNNTRELFIADTWNKRIQVFSLDGAALRSWNVQAWGPTTESGNRPYLALDPTGTYLFATDPDAGRIMVFNTQGQPLLSFTRADGLLSGIAVDALNRIFVVESNNGLISRFTKESLPGFNVQQAPPANVQPSDQQQQGTPDEF